MGPPFQTVSYALRWAHRVTDAKGAAISSIYRMRGAEPTRGDGSVMDALAQAAQIKRVAREVLSDEEYAYVCARFWGAFESAGLLVGVVMGALAGANPGAAAQKLVLLYCGQKVGERAIRYELRVSDGSLRRQKGDAFDRLDKLHHRTLGTLEGAFREKGWLK